MTSKSRLFTVGVILVIGFFAYRGRQNVESSLGVTSEESATALDGSPVQLSDALDAKSPLSAVVVSQATSQVAKRVSFIRELERLGACLDVKNSLAVDDLPTVENLALSLKSDLGEVEIADEWENVHFTQSSGELRRIRWEVEASGEEAHGKKLSLYGVDKEDLPVPLPLDSEVARNPTEDGIRALVGDGIVTLKEKGAQIGFSQGARGFLTERNGMISELEVTHKDKTFKCSQLDGAGKCLCL